MTHDVAPAKVTQQPAAKKPSKAAQSISNTGATVPATPFSVEGFPSSILPPFVMPRAAHTANPLASLVQFYPAFHQLNSSHTTEALRAMELHAAKALAAEAAQQKMMHSLQLVYGGALSQLPSLQTSPPPLVSPARDVDMEDA